MAQHDYVIANGTGAAVRSDLNNALAAIVSNNSGATAPSTTYAYQWWADTTTNLLKLRNSTNNGWVTLFQLDGEWSTIPLESGTAGAPSIYFKDSGTDTGFYSPGTDQVGITTGGTSRLLIDSSGRVGIGTVSPSQRLEVQGSAVLFGNGTSDIDVILGVSGYGTRFEYSTGKLFLRTNSNNRLTVDNSGNVGLGSTSPAARLDCVGSVTLLGATNVSARFTDNVTSNFLIGHPSGGGIDLTGNVGLNFCTTDGTTKSERARIDSSGRLLVGTSTARSNVYVGSSAFTPGVQFESVTNTYNNGLSLVNYSASGYAPVLTLGSSLSNTQGANALVTSGNDLGIINFVANDGTNFRSGAYITAAVDATSGSGDIPTRLVFSTTADGASSPTERARITSNGDFLVGATSRTNFERLGAVQTGNGNAALFSCTDASLTETVLRLNATRNTTNNTYYFLQCYNATAVANRLLIADSGNVTNANNSYTGISDIKLKENIVDANSQWSDIKSLQVRNYNFKEETGQATHRQIGLIAQEVEQICPNLVDESSDRDAEGNDLGTVTKSVNYSVLYMKAVKALQEAMERIEALEAKVAALEAS
jgi:hypothetical protein